MICRKQKNGAVAVLLHYFSAVIYSEFGVTNYKLKFLFYAMEKMVIENRLALATDDAHMQTT